VRLAPGELDRSRGLRDLDCPPQGGLTCHPARAAAFSSAHEDFTYWRIVRHMGPSESASKGGASRALAGTAIPGNFSSQLDLKWGDLQMM